MHTLSLSRYGQTVAPPAGVGQEPRTSGERRSRRPKRSTVVTRSPDVAAPALRCPNCDRPLIYLQTVFGGVKPVERWDYFQCVRCGFYEYRSRTRTVRQTADVPDIIRRTP
jgi:hypothetical protein